MTKFGFEAIASPLLPGEERRTVVREYADLLARAGGIESTPDAHDAGRTVVYFVLTGGTEARILEHAHVAPDKPVLLVAYPGRNSLPAALETLARLEQDGRRGRIIFLEGPDDRAGAQRLADALASETGDTTSVARRPKPTGHPLAGQRVGLVGPPSDWLVASSPSPKVVTEAWGPEIVEISMDDLEGRIDSSSPAPITTFAESFTSGATRISEPTAKDFAASGSIYEALRALVDELKLDAISVRCFDLVVEREATGCLALSRLADEGIVAGCEGDLPSALAMLWIRQRLEATTWMANPARVDVTANRLTLAHCTVPCSMVDGFELRSHFESRLGAAVQGCMPTGPVTLLRIGGRALDRVWVAEGELVSTGCEETLCRTQVDIVLSKGHVSDLLEHPLGNHLVLARGYIAGELLDGDAPQ
jgi:L-fucose isomerase-like protein